MGISRADLEGALKAALTNACREEFAALQDELDITKRVFEDPTVGGGVASAIRGIPYGGRMAIRERRIQAMLYHAAEKLKFSWD